MTTSVSTTWSRVRQLLEDRAPASARCLRPPASREQIDSAQRTMGLVFPECLVELLSLTGGVEPDPRAGLLLPPMYLPVSLLRATELWRRKLEISGDSPSNNESTAGAAIQGYSKYFFPVGDDTTGDLLVVDLRPGDLHGCIVAWGNVDGHFGSPVWGSVVEMWSDVADALETGSPAGSYRESDPHLTRNGCAALFAPTGIVEWEF
ncbi:SMI1/KNR4 family protein [Streptomyces sp. YGL11-2]|uniref:SMI1/KNR4 family protein n=1 Tax=Streptomyces sp. YGL11-2 TaxID=3414028 RepID=UPI003CF5A90A